MNQRQTRAGVQPQAPDTVRTKLTVRPARADDRGALHTLLVQSWMTTWAPHCPPDAVERFKQLDPASQILADTLGEIEIVCLGQEIVGALHRIAHTLKDIHVAPKFQRRGIGTAMMDYAEARGVTRLEVRAFNRGAIAFYEERGWVRVDSFDATEMGAPAVTYEYRRQ